MNHTVQILNKELSKLLDRKKKISDMLSMYQELVDENIERELDLSLKITSIEQSIKEITKKPHFSE